MLFSRVIFYLFQALFFLTPLVWLTKTSELFEFPKMLIVYSSAILITTTWILRMVFEKQVIFKRTFLDLPLFLFFTSQLISTLFSIDPHTSLFGYYSRFHGGLLSTLAYLSLYYAFVSNLSRRDAHQSLITILGTGFLASLYAFPEHFGHSPSCLKVTGQFNAACWVQDVQTRVFGTFGQPNWLAAYLITIIFIPIAKLMESGSKKHESGIKPSKLFLILESCIIFLMFSVLLFTKSRSGLLGLAVGMLFFVIFYLIYIKRHHLPLPLKPLISYFLILISCFILFGRGFHPQTDRLFALFSQSKPVTPAAEAGQPVIPSGTQLEIGGTESGDIRRIVWTGALDLWKKYPLFGSGVETFAYGYYQTRPLEHNLVSEWDFLYNKAHNEFLNFLATTGLFGLASYLSIIVVYFVWSVKQIINHKSDLINHALLSGYLALAVSNFLGFSTVPVGLLFFLFPALAFLLHQDKSPDTIPSLKTQPMTNSQLILSSLIILVSGYFVLQVINLYRSDLNYTQGKRLGEAGQLVNAITLLSKASDQNPREPLYTDELSYNVAKAAISLHQTGEATKAAMVARQAETLTNQVISKNKVHLNYYKTRARVFAAISTVDNAYIYKALNALEEAIKLAPTDAKLYYNLGLIKEQLGETEEAAKLYQQTIEMKPNYEAARMSLAEIYYTKKDYPQAIEQYQYILTRINPNNDTAASRSAITN